MRIAVVNAMAPFIWGGAEELAHHLVRNLRQGGHTPTLLRIPFAWEPFSGIPAEMSRMKALRLDQFDRVISLKFPVYLLEAKRHSTWLIHQYRQAYDLWGSPYGNIPQNAAGDEVRRLIIEHDNQALGHGRKLFTISNEVSDRLESFNGIKAAALRAPLNDPHLFSGGPFGDYILAPGRINDSKRQFLAIEAMAHLGPEARLIIAGPPERKEDEHRLRKLVLELGLENQVKLDLRFLGREELATYVNNCRAVIYSPFKEDSYGYVTMEAFEAGKPVITIDDAGELLELVQDGQTGSVTAPKSEQIAQAMAIYFGAEELARERGQAGRALWRGKNINWAENIDRLLED